MVFLVRFGAYCGVILGLLIAVPGVIEAFTGETAATSFVLGASVALGPPLITALHLRQSGATGGFGRVGYAVNAVGLGLFGGAGFTLNMALFFLDEAVVAELLRGPTRFALLGSAAVFVVGTVLFGIAMLRAGVHPQVPTWGYLIAMPAFALLAPLPDTLLTNAIHLLVGISLGWLSVATLRAVESGSFIPDARDHGWGLVGASAGQLGLDQPKVPHMLIKRSLRQMAVVIGLSGALLGGALLDTGSAARAGYDRADGSDRAAGYDRAGGYDRADGYDRFDGDDTKAQAPGVVTPGDRKKDRLNGPRPFDGRGPGWYGVWAYDVNVRLDGQICYDYPSTRNCWRVLTRVSPPATVYVHCQKQGQPIGGNPYWVYVTTRNGTEGFMASYYIRNRTNFIDGVPYC